MPVTDVLIAGGAGFIGSHLCDRLLGQGHRVLAIDNFTTGSADNLHHLAAHARFRLQRHDVVQPWTQEADAIYNLACPASPMHYQRDAIQTTLTSVLGVHHLLEVAARSGARLFQASTSEVYGDPAVSPQPEGYHGNVNPVGPRACYDEGKRCAETLCMAYHQQRGVPVRIARIFNTYGPRLQPGDGRVVSNFVVQALRGDDLTVYGSGEQTRSFCYIDDLIDGILRLMAGDAHGPINLGNPDQRTVLELAEIVLRLTGSRSRIVHHPLPVDDPKLRCPDITLAMQTLGWQPRVTLDDGLRETIRYSRDMLE
jgi:UDP-glucuronate decarboxylase